MRCTGEGPTLRFPGPLDPGVDVNPEPVGRPLGDRSTTVAVDAPRP